MDQVRVLEVWDYVVVALAMAGSLAIGLYFRFSGEKKKTNEEYLLARKSMSLFPVGISLMSSFISGITVLGNSAETYTFGLIFIVNALGYILTIPVIIALFLPVFYKLNTTSTYEYLEMRFGPIVRRVASLAYTIQMLLYNGIVIYAPAIALEAVTGLDKYLSIVLVGVVSTLYSTLGGMKAVIWTDSLQSSLMFISMILVIVFGTIEVGGFSNVFKYAQDGGRLNFDSISADPTVRHTWWSLIIGGFFTNISLLGVNHTQVVRFKSLPTLKMAKQAVWMGNILICLSTIVSAFSGIVIYAVYKDCDPRSNQVISANDQVLPLFVMDYISYIPALAGVFVAGLLCASLSTISSACNGLAAVTVSDYLGRWIKPSLLWSKFIVFAYSLLIIGLAFVAERLGGMTQAAITLFGAFGGPLLAVFSMGILTTYNNEYGAVIGLITGLSFNMWMGFGSPRPASITLPMSTDGCNSSLTSMISPYERNTETSFFYLYRISYQFYGLIGFCIVFIVGSIVSLLWKKKQPWEIRGEKYPNPELFCPPLARKIRMLIEEEHFDKNEKSSEFDENERKDEFDRNEKTDELVTEL